MKTTTALAIIIGIALTFTVGCDTARDIVKEGGDGNVPDTTYNPVIAPANFVEKIDNPYFHLTPGITFIYQGESEDAPERVEVNITNETKVILGVTCIVVRDRVWIDDELAEDTFDWYAQDKDGNVWYFGEDSREMEDGVVVSTQGSWEAGVDGAKPGIIMKATPKVGDSYRQELYTGVAEDMGEVLGLNESVTVPFGTFENCLKTKDFTPLEPGVAEHKYYAPGVGFIKSVTVEGGVGQVELVEIR